MDEMSDESKVVENELDKLNQQTTEKEITDKHLEEKV